MERKLKTFKVTTVFKQYSGGDFGVVCTRQRTRNDEVKETSFFLQNRSFKFTNPQSRSDSFIASTSDLLFN